MKISEKVLQTDRKHFGERRICSLRANFPFPRVFSKDMYCRHLKSKASMRKAKRYINALFLPIFHPYLHFFRGSVLGQDTSEPSLVLVKSRKDMKNVSCRRDMTEILLKAA